MTAQLYPTTESFLRAYIHEWETCEGMCAHLVLDLAGDVPEAGVLWRLPPGALHCRRERLW